MKDEYISGSVNLIEIKIKKVGQLFNSFDPSPFLEKDLDDDAFEYIVSSVSEHPKKTRHKIIIHMPSSQRGKVSELEIKRAIHNFFEYKAGLADKKVMLTIKEGEFSLVIGFVVLFACLGLRDYFLTLSSSSFMTILAEGLSIGSWVALWKPISNILYDWWPRYTERNIYRKISETDIELRFN